MTEATTNLTNTLLSNLSPESTNIVVKRTADPFIFQYAPQQLCFTAINNQPVGILVAEDAADAASAIQKYDAGDKPINLYIHPNWSALDAEELYGRTMVSLKTFNKANKIKVFYQGQVRPYVSPWVFIAEAQSAYVGLTMQRGNQINPETFVTYTRALFHRILPTVNITVLTQADCIKLKMDAFVAMGRGAAVAPRVLIIEYVSDPRAQRIALVGKGVTYDTGGINLKTEDINNMYTDKAGAAAVVCAVYGLALKQAQVNVVAVAGLIENAIGPLSVRPDDILTTMSGKTIEVVDTDAEGRVILADLLWYTGMTYKPSIMIDMATLTSDMAQTFHMYRVPIFGNQASVIKHLLAIGEKTGERLWPMPLIEEIDVSSLFATVKNISKDPCDGLYAARFLSEFVPSSVPAWIHIDFGGICISDEQIVNPFGPNLLMTFIESVKNI